MLVELFYSSKKHIMILMMINCRRFLLSNLRGHHTISPVALTVTKKKSYETKKELVSEIQDCCDKFAHIFLIEVHNERNNLIKEIRESWKHSRYFIMKNWSTFAPIKSIVLWGMSYHWQLLFYTLYLPCFLFWRGGVIRSPFFNSWYCFDLPMAKYSGLILYTNLKWWILFNSICVIKPSPKHFDCTVPQETKV